MSFGDEQKTKKLFKKFPFHNFLIKNPKIKGLKNIDLLHDLPFYDELNFDECQKHWGGMQEVIKLK